MKKTIILFLILFCLTPAFSKSFYIKSADISVKVLESGLVSVSEELTFTFDGCYSVVYRDLPLGSRSYLIDFEGSSDEPFTENRIQQYQVYTYEFQFKDYQCDKDVTVLMEYSMGGVIDVYEDVSSLHFQFWGAEWERLGSLNVMVTAPSSFSDYWIHNEVIGNTYSSSDNTISYSASSVPSGHWVEVQALFSPLSQSDYVEMHTGTYADKIRNQELAYSVLQFVELFLSVLIVALPLVSFWYFYNKYGKEIIVDYMGVYERNPPTKDSPALVTAKLNAHLGGEPNLDAFIATMFDLARRKMLQIKGDEKDVVIKINKKELLSLSDYEVEVVDFLNKYVDENDEVAWKTLKRKLGSYSDSMSFQKIIRSFKSKVKDDFNTKDYFDSKGNNEFLKFNGLFIVFAFLANFVLMPMSAGLGLMISLIPAIIVMIGVFIFLTIISYVGKVLGRWTRIGRNFDLKWNNFKKFLKDYSELKSHPAQSIVLWEHFLVYAIALGVADNVIKVMKLSVPDFQKRSNFGILYYHPHFYSSMRTSMYSSSMRSSSRSGGGFGGGGGGFGGGFGGGGGGAR